MRKIILGAILLFSVVCFGQDSVLSLGMNYGFKANSLAVDITTIKSNSMIFGAGVSISFNSPDYIGIELNENYGWNTPNYTKTGPSLSGYGICGYMFDKFKTYGKIGVGSYETVGYYNHYDQWHYKILDNNIEPLIGVGVGFVDKTLTYDLGFDSFNGLTIGIAVNF